MRILFIDIDTLRPDHMGCYGYYRNTTPNIDQVAARGLRFDRYYCSDAPCLPSRAALASGMFGIKNGVVGHGGTAADRRLMGANRDFRNEEDQNNLFNIFRKKGMYTASISTFPERHSAWWFNSGFKETHNVGGGGKESGEEVLPVALDWLDRKGGNEDWFLHLHFWDPHTPYRAPANFGNPFADSPCLEWITGEIFQEHLRATGPHSLLECRMFDDSADPAYPRMPGKVTGYEELRTLLDGYDTGILYADYLVGKLFGHMKELGIYEDTAIIISSDHGETMGEFGIYSEHGTADEATCRIPMIIKWPGGPGGAVDTAFRYNLDLAPTMAELLAVKPHRNWDGKSYAAVLEGKPCPGWDYLVLSQMAHVCQRSARFGKWIYMRTYHDGFRLFDQEMLFDLEADPHERFDVKEEYPGLCDKGARMILDWHDQMMLSSGNQIDPLWTVLAEGGPSHTKGCLPKYLERLEKTGRADKARLLREKYQP